MVRLPEQDIISKWGRRSFGCPFDEAAMAAGWGTCARFPKNGYKTIVPVATPPSSSPSLQSPHTRSS